MTEIQIKMKHLLSLIRLVKIKSINFTRRGRCVRREHWLLTGVRTAARMRLNKADAYPDSRSGGYRVAATDGSHRSGEMEWRSEKCSGENGVKIDGGPEVPRARVVAVADGRMTRLAQKPSRCPWPPCGSSV